MTRQCLKLQEFPAHSAQINCARFGERVSFGAKAGEVEGGLLSTGGADMRVAVWEMGKPQAIALLTGAKSAIETVAFDRKEEMIVAGTAGGAIHMWNLEVRRAIAKLPGHRTSCTSLEVHPYGEFFASGSNDTNMKIWDMRTHTCIQTYRGHTGPINCMKFSPHGRWIATGGEDGIVKLWDLSACRVMKEFPHKSPITSMDFHLSQYYFAVATTARHIAIWNVENFKFEGVTDLQASQIQKVKFDPDQDHFYSVASDSLRSYSISQLGGATETVDVRWGTNVKDLTFVDGTRSPNTSICALGVSGNNVQLWKIDEEKVPREDKSKNFADRATRAPRSQQSAPSLQQQARASPTLRASPPTRSSPDLSNDESSASRDERNGTQPPLESSKVLLRKLDESRLRNRLARNDAEARQYLESLDNDPLDKLISAASSSSERIPSQSSPRATGFFGQAKEHENQWGPADRFPSFPDRPQSSASSHSRGDDSGKPTRQASPQVVGRDLAKPPWSPRDNPDRSLTPPTTKSRPRREHEPYGFRDNISSLGDKKRSDDSTTCSTLHDGEKREDECGDRGNATTYSQLHAGKKDRRDPVPPTFGSGGLAQFAPAEKAYSSTMPPYADDRVAPDRVPDNNSQFHDSLRDFSERVSKQHNDVMELLQSRLDVAKRMKHFWDERRFADLCALTDRGNDRGAFVDFIKTLKQQRLVTQLNLEACCRMLPILKVLMNSRYESYTQAAVDFAYVLLQSFRSVIIEVRHQFSRLPGYKLDIAAEERLRKCNQSVTDFTDIRRAMDDKKFPRVCEALDEFICQSG
eukprot:GEMP01008754.1.p1 GENE.GEMP01008754.1~~GEMP01008754.1.p1  ORF type:complete len:856 (+),score=161.08 GEMP01008754.1:148-2568(+)